SDAREATWALVQQGISIIDFDYPAYAQEHLDRLIANAGAPDYRELLQTAAVRDPDPAGGRIRRRASSSVGASGARASRGISRKQVAPTCCSSSEPRSRAAPRST